MSFIITKKTHILSTVMASILAIVQINTISNITENLLINFGDYAILKYYLLLIGMVAVNALIHELIHGLAYLGFGGKFKIGFKVIFAYTKETTGIKLTVTQFLVVLLTPLTLISILSLFIPAVGVLMFIVNLLGSTGDLIMAFWLIKVNKNSLILDSDKGFDIID